MKVKTVSRTGWPRILSGREFVSKRSDQELDGILALFYLERVSAPLVKTMGGYPVIIADNDYYWMQYGPRGKNFWLTAMLNRKREIVQWYFDITLKNDLDCPEGPKFYDLYLDVAVTAAGKCFLLDEDELLEAFQAGEFDREVYNMAYRTAYNIIRQVSEHMAELTETTRTHFKELIREADWDRENSCNFGKGKV